jgi:hypothetical protein
MAQQDISLLYQRYQFIGWEFLTWLWYRMRTDGSEVAAASDEEPLGLALGNRMVLENRSREGTVETITIRGDDAGLEEGLLALRKGAYVTEMNLQIELGEQLWRLTIKGENLSVGGLKTPPTAKVEALQEIEGAVLEKLFLIDMVLQRLDSLFAKFIKLRISPAWEHVEAPAIRQWVENSARVTT